MRDVRAHKAERSACASTCGGINQSRECGCVCVIISILCAAECLLYILYSNILRLPLQRARNRNTTIEIRQYNIHVFLQYICTYMFYDSIPPSKEKRQRRRAEHTCNSRTNEQSIRSNCVYGFSILLPEYNAI